MRHTSRIAPAVLFLAVTGCASTTAHDPPDATPVVWHTVDSIDVAAFNADLQPGRLTMDVGVYFPSNLDPKFDKVTLPRLMESLRAAKEIYEPAGVQINLLWVKTGALDPRFFALQSDEFPGVPSTGYVNLYEHMRRDPGRLTERTRRAFGSIVEPRPDSHRTIYLVVLQDVFMPYLEVAEGRNWMLKTVRTGGLSFPTYSYGATIPAPYRGVITITNLSRPDRYRRTVAHEIGHKAINVSHEYRDISPAHEVYAEGGLMVYGNGEAIESGAEGRWHLERLHLSPFLYRLTGDGGKDWNPEYREGGHYYDPIYGDYVVHFEGTAAIDEDW